MTATEPTVDAVVAARARRRDAMVLAGGGIVAQGLTAVTGILSARLLGVEGRGQVALVAAVVVLASQLTYGGSLPNAVAHLLAGRGVTARDGLRGHVRRWALGALVPAAIGAAYLAFLLLRDETGAATTAGLAATLFVIAMQTMTLRILLGSLQGEGAVTRMMLAALAPQVVFTTVLVVVFVLAVTLDVEVSALQVLVLQATAFAAGLVVGVRQLRRPRGEPADRLDPADLRSVSRRTYLGSVGPIDGLGLDRTLVGSVLGTASLGLYAAATAVANLSSIVGTGFAQTVLPQVSARRHDPEARREVVRHWLGLSVLAIAVVVVGLQVVVEPIIVIAFGPDFEGAVTTARWLVVADGILGLRRVLIAVLQGLDRGGVASAIELALTPFVVGGILVAAWHDSLVGVGVTMVAVAVLACSLLGFAVRRGLAAAPAAAAPGAPS